MVEDAERRLSRLEKLTRTFMEHVPHNRALGIRLDALGDGEAVMTLPYDDKLVGDPASGVLHGGAVTAVMDACSGAAAFMSLPEPAPAATLDLRIDYLKPATKGRDVVARATCYKRTRNVAFVRCVAFHDDPNEPIAAAMGTFMLSIMIPRSAPSQAKRPAGDSSPSGSAEGRS
jgi:uncharacterized protein (TIGR00369 family)